MKLGKVRLKRILSEETGIPIRDIGFTVGMNATATRNSLQSGVMRLPQSMTVCGSVSP